MRDHVMCGGSHVTCHVTLGVGNATCHVIECIYYVNVM